MFIFAVATRACFGTKRAPILPDSTLQSRVGCTESISCLD